MLGLKKEIVKAIVQRQRTDDLRKTRLTGCRGQGKKGNIETLLADRRY